MFSWCAQPRCHAGCGVFARLLLCWSGLACGAFIWVRSLFREMLLLRSTAGRHARRPCTARPTGPRCAGAWRRTSGRQAVPPDRDQERNRDLRGWTRTWTWTWTWMSTWTSTSTSTSTLNLRRFMNFAETKLKIPYYVLKSFARRSATIANAAHSCSSF